MTVQLLEFFKVVLFGLVEGITEWLPISSTGHMILLDEFLPMQVSASFKEMFLVVIQLGAVLAVAVLFFKQLVPCTLQGGFHWKKESLSMWGNIFIACIPAAVYGVLLDDKISPYLYNYQTVAVMLVIFGILFILVENWNKNRSPKITAINQIHLQTALLIGLFQLFAAVFPGTSRSGATILGALLIGVSRSTAAEFTFFLAIPTMLGASLLKLVKFGFDFSAFELLSLLTGMLVAFLVSMVAIRFLMNYVKKHDFKFFGWYRIALGAIVLLYFIFR